MVQKEASVHANLSSKKIVDQKIKVNEKSCKQNFFHGGTKFNFGSHVSTL